MFRNLINRRIVSEVSKELGYDEDVVEAVYRSQWLYIRNKIESIPIKNTMTKDELEQYVLSFHVQKIGKFYTNYDRLLKIFKQRSNIEEIIKRESNDDDKVKED